jgi:hypothetical protein
VEVPGRARAATERHRPARAADGVRAAFILATGVDNAAIVLAGMSAGVQMHKKLDKNE